MVGHRRDHQPRASRNDLLTLCSPGVRDDGASTLFDLRTNVCAILCACNHTIEFANSCQNHRGARLQRDDALWRVVRSHGNNLNRAGVTGGAFPVRLHVTIAAMYSPQVLDHFQNPRNAGDVPNPDASVQLENPACGDVLRLTLKVTDGRITEIRFRAKGCVPAMACASLLTELVQGRSLDEARRLRREDLVQAIGSLPEASAHAGHLAVDALRAALAKVKA